MGQGEVEKGCASRWFWTWGLGWGCEPQTHVLAAGVSAQSFLHCFSLASAAFNLQVATPGVSPATLLASCWGGGGCLPGARLGVCCFPWGAGSVHGALGSAMVWPRVGDGSDVFLTLSVCSITLEVGGRLRGWCPSPSPCEPTVGTGCPPSPLGSCRGRPWTSWM